MGFGVGLFGAAVFGAVSWVCSKIFESESSRPIAGQSTSKSYQSTPHYDYCEYAGYSTSRSNHYSTPQYSDHGFAGHSIYSGKQPSAAKEIRPKPKPTFKHVHVLDEFVPPLNIRNTLLDESKCDGLLQISNIISDHISNNKLLQPHNIGPTLTDLLYVEDVDILKEYLNLSLPPVTLQKDKDTYSFKINPTLLESGSDLSPFDDVVLTTGQHVTAQSRLRIILTSRDDLIDNQSMFVGSIDDITSDAVSFKLLQGKFDSKQRNISLDLSLRYTVVFRPTRLTLRYQYRALTKLRTSMHFLKKFLFPDQLLWRNPSNAHIELFNKSIYSNPDQLQAVQNIAEGPRNDATYIIYGPPGTGKTTTVVESILQVYRRPHTKILVTASSNSACDEIALRLCNALPTLECASKIMLRLYAQLNANQRKTIHPVVLKHSNLQGSHNLPPVDELQKYAIVICTMSFMGKLELGDFGKRCLGSPVFTHLFIDEVAAATEIEALIPITAILSPSSCLIISGDDKQLGPVLKSKRAEELGLGVSLMERLLKRGCYGVDAYTGDHDRSIQTRLRLNFRSHPAIVDLYSAMYYNGELKSKAKLEDVSLCKDWHLSPNKEYPIIFHCAYGRSERDNKSLSLYNVTEINVVMQYVRDLMTIGINNKPVAQSDIGIVSPYKCQYMRIRKQLDNNGWKQIETGSVELFQGREKPIILVSFVRSRTPSLGFLESPRRLNVTISRAKSILVLVGNPKTLNINADFKRILNECKRHGTVLHEGKQSVDRLNNSFKDLTLQNNNGQRSRNKKKTPASGQVEHSDWRQRNNNKQDCNRNKSKIMAAI